MNSTLEYLYSLERFGIKLGLDVMNQLMELLDHPEKKFRSIHVTGTNGKGSVCAFLASVLQKAGYNVGLYTSPHLVRFNERIKVIGVDISDNELIRLTEFIRSKMGTLEPTFFEFTTALAFLYFAQRKVDVAVVEVGMGGRLDATNVITPEVAVITHVAFDHQEYLGKTLLDIAREKAGIIKRGVPVVTAETNPEILTYFKKICAEKESQLLVVQDKLQANVILEEHSFQEFVVSGVISRRFTIPLLGEHQVTNACTALLVLHSIQNKFPMSAYALSAGLAEAVWHGRLMVVSEKPLIIVDGAHNVDGMIILSHYIASLSHRRMLLLGIAEDKDVSGMVKLIVPPFDEVIVTQGNFKPTAADVLAKEVRTHCASVRVIPSAAAAFEAALDSVGENELLLVTGSLYLVGDVLKLLEKKLAV